MSEKKSGQYLFCEYVNRRNQWEQQIQNYVGNDPLSVWFAYILWLETNPSPASKDDAQKDVQKMEEVLNKCLNTFDKDTRYRQDPRLIKIFIKYVSTSINILLTKGTIFVLI